MIGATIGHYKLDHVVEELQKIDNPSFDVGSFSPYSMPVEAKQCNRLNH